MQNRFQKGTGCYTCAVCGKQTRDTGAGEAGCGLCAGCYEMAGWENAHSDRDHQTNPDPACPICKEEGLVITGG